MSLFTRIYDTFLQKELFGCGRGRSPRLRRAIFVSKHSILHKYICIYLYTLRPPCSLRLNIIEFSEFSVTSVANFKVWSFEFWICFGFRSSYFVFIQIRVTIHERRATIHPPHLLLSSVLYLVHLCSYALCTFSPFVPPVPFCCQTNPFNTVYKKQFLASLTNGALQNDPADEGKSLWRKLAFRAELAEDTKLAKTNPCNLWNPWPYSFVS